MMTEPNATPSREERIKARDAPMKTIQIESALEARSMVESCVLSPSSAIKTKKKTVNRVFHIIYTRNNIIK